MDEKKIVYEIIVSVWSLVKEYMLHELSENEAAAMVSKADSEEKRFKEYGESYNLLFRDLWSAFTRYYYRRGVNEKET